MARLNSSLRHQQGALPLVLLTSLLNGPLSCGGRAVSARGDESSNGSGSSGPAGSATAPSRPFAGLPMPERPIMETCEENPLLVGCPAPAACPENPLACPAPPEPPLSGPPARPPRRSEDLSLPEVQRMEALLDEECGSCHGSEARRSCTGICDGMLYIDDMQQLLDNEKILPCDWGPSPIAQRLRDGSMPPRYSGLAPMPIRAQRQLEAFVENMCTELLYPGSTRTSTAQQVLRESCGACHGAPAPDAGPAPGGLARIDDVAALIDGGYLIPCRSQASPIILAIQNESMPPPGSGVPPMTGPRLVTLIDYIDGPCAPFTRD